MKKIINLIMKNPQTFILAILTWMMYFIAYISLHYNGDVSKWEQVLISLMLSFCAAAITMFFMGFSAFIHGKKSQEKIETNPGLIERLSKRFDFAALKFSSDFSITLFTLSLFNFIYAGIVFLICYFKEYTFRTFIFIMLAVIAFSFLERMLWYIKRKTKPPTQ